MKTIIYLTDHTMLKVKNSVEQIMYDVCCGKDAWLTLTTISGTKWEVQVSHIVSMHEIEDE